MGRRKKIKSKDIENVVGCGCLVIVLSIISGSIQLAYEGVKFGMSAIFSSNNADIYSDFKTGIASVIAVVLGLFFILFVVSLSVKSFRTRRDKRNEKKSNDRRRERARIQQEKLLGSTLEDIDAMTGYEFEKWIVAVLNSQNIKADIPTKSADYGVDIIAQIDNLKFGIQAKRYSKNVGIKAIQEIYLGIQHWKCDVAVVVTQSKFTKPAQKVSRSSPIPILLIDRQSLEDLPAILLSHAANALD